MGPQQIADTCPACGTSWIADEIPADLRHHYGGVTHYRRTIGIYDLYKDTRVAVACPDCGTRFKQGDERLYKAE
jgi:endogenous inhibitor of DNA gyrase (YacG/DUF329 family)